MEVTPGNTLKGRYRSHDTVLALGVPPYTGRSVLPGELLLSGVTVPGDDDGLFHYVDAVTLHPVLKQIKNLLCSGTLQGKTPPPRRAVTTALEGEEVGVIAIAAQAEVGPPDSISLVSVQDELRLCQLHNPKSHLVTFIVHLHYLKFGGMLVWDAVSAQTTAAAPHDVSVRGNTWGEDTKQRTHMFSNQLLPLSPDTQHLQPVSSSIPLHVPVNGAVFALRLR